MPVTPPRARRPAPPAKAPSLPAGVPRFPYVDRTRHPTINLVFLAPFLLMYILCWWSVGDAVETQAAASLRSLLRLFGPRGLFVLTLITCLALCGVVLVRLRVARADAGVYPGMLIEGIVYGLLLEHMAWMLTKVLPVGEWMGIPLARLPAGLPEVRALGIAIGAGIFEELLFRGLLCMGILHAVRHVLGADRWSSGAIAVVASALLFSAYHHWGPGGEPWSAINFTFRFHAGLILGAIFLGRGLGIAAFAHGFYDALVLLA
ncbi:MAG TPA: CPBP family intramembrane glutamic endopeptidase [Planctomycetota bacterium]|nr:CPBP family intramembrane glutamic endopeptidase [Planctomycetota bacterium]